MNSIEVLEKYWGYTVFRPLQLEIIESVIAGNDTLALLPTGGGKSICFQVPALVMEGICLVVSPLIALMKDQVSNLSSRGVPVSLLISGMSYHEIDQTLDDCIYNGIKLLYLSPERLRSSLVRERIKKMKINLIAVDEAHCISQWGYDFRPSYLEIVALRELVPSVPVLALTATATQAVSVDIQKQLKFKLPHVISKSFYRENLYYDVLEADDKVKKIIELLESFPGSSIVYVRTRRQASDIALILARNGISAGYYHAGLELKERENIQFAWVTNKLRVIVATNAFGMGIDKPDVRSVIHYAPPQNLEAFYQEAGRAGRDEARAEAILIYNKTDIAEAERLFLESFPAIGEIRIVYQALAELYQVGIGSGEGQYFNFDLNSFCIRNNFKNTHVLICLKILDQNSLISLNDGVLNPSKVKFLVSQSGLSSFMKGYPRSNSLIQALLRSYGGIFENDLRINEKELGLITQLNEDEILAELNFLHLNKIIRFSPRTEMPQFCFKNGRVDSGNLQIDFATYRQKKINQRVQLDAILGYIINHTVCRNTVLLAYFGEDTHQNCERCDICLQRKIKPLNRESIKILLLDLLKNKPLELNNLKFYFSETAEVELLDIVRFCIDSGLVEFRLGQLSLVAIS